MKKAKNILGLIFVIVVMSACQQASTTPISTPNELAPYYGSPEPIQIIINGKIYDSEIGTTQWIKLDADGRQYMEIGDAFAIITPTEPILMKSNPSFTLKLPIPINPTELWYAIFPVTEDEIKSQDRKDDVYRWQPNYKQQPQLPLLAEQQLSLSPEPGFYVLEVHAGWGGIPPHTELEADYGFLLEIQE